MERPRQIGNKKLYFHPWDVIHGICH